MTADTSVPAAGGDRRRTWPGRAVRGRRRRAGSAERMRILTVGGRAIRVSVRDRRCRAGAPLLLCNGIGASLELLQPFVDELDQRRPVIRFDMPGVGGSPAPVLPYHLATSAPLLAGLLDQLGYPQADVLGISWGGALAQQFALSRPDRVRRLVLVATGPGALMVPARPKVLLRMLTPAPSPRSRHAARIAGDLYGGSARTDPTVARDLLHATTRLGPARGYFYQLLATAGWTSLPRLAAAAAAGPDPGRRRRPDHPAGQRADHALAHTGSELHVYQGGHLELAAHPERIAPVVEAFLDNQPHATPPGQAMKGSQR